MNQLTEYRREFHKYPENGWREFRTSARVAEILTGMGYDVAMGPDVIEPGSVGEPERLSEEQIRQEMERAVRQGADPAFVKRTQGWPGVMAVLDTGREGPVSAMRFEMDCLPYDEPQRPGYRPCDEGYLSCNPQSVHACGHDGHTAIGLGIAAELMKRKGELKGKIKLFFQPAEETFYGAQSIVDKGHLDDVMNFIAVHIALSAENKPLPSHTVACGCRDFLSDRQLDVYLEGKAAHPCGASQEGKNALLAACSAASAAGKMASSTVRSPGTHLPRLAIPSAKPRRNAAKAEASTSSFPIRRLPPSIHPEDISVPMVEGTTLDIFMPALDKRLPMSASSKPA